MASPSPGSSAEPYDAADADCSDGGGRGPYSVGESGGEAGWPVPPAGLGTADARAEDDGGGGGGGEDEDDGGSGAEDGRGRAEGGWRTGERFGEGEADRAVRRSSFLRLLLRSPPLSLSPDDDEDGDEERLLRLELRLRLFTRSLLPPPLCSEDACEFRLRRLRERRLPRRRSSSLLSSLRLRLRRRSRVVLSFLSSTASSSCLGSFPSSLAERSTGVGSGGRRPRSFFPLLPSSEYSSLSLSAQSPFSPF